MEDKEEVMWDNQTEPLAQRRPERTTTPLVLYLAALEQLLLILPRPLSVITPQSPASYPSSYVATLIEAIHISGSSLILMFISGSGSGSGSDMYTQMRSPRVALRSWCLPHFISKK